MSEESRVEITKSEATKGPQTVKSLKEELDPRIASLEGEIAQLASYINELTKAITHTFHVVGAPHDILLKHGVKPYSKDKTS